MVNNWLFNMQSILSGQDCPLCGNRLPAQSPSLLCPGCQADLPLNRPACRRCAEPLPHPGLPLCGLCLQQPPDMHQTLVPFRYQAPFTRLVPDLKFHGRLGNARLMSQLMLTHLQGAIHDGVMALPDGLIPVPLHAKRLRARGFNQSLEIARGLSRPLHIPLDRHGVIRQRDTLPQSDLDKPQRRHNIRSAFRVTRPLPWRHVAIVDDVVTTANTVNELARTLKKAGVEKVDVWAVARA